jgi:peptidoglycan/xylan/chitin deacetylase (PgdA/CDA1 family)
MSRAWAAGLTACAALLALAPERARAQEIAFTFDDLPAHSVLPPGVSRLEVARSIIAALKAAGVAGVYGFVNGALLQSEPASGAVLPAWRAAGFPLGNHTWTHLNLDTEPLGAWEADVIANESLLAAEMGQGDWRWLRFPFLAEGGASEKREAARAFLAGRGYRIAQVTMSFGDYAYNEPYARCMAKGDHPAVARLESAYLLGAREEIGRARGMSKALLGRDIPYVLLMHLGAFDARMLPRLLDLYRREGFRFVTLQQAQKDPFYRADIDLSAPAAPDTLEAAMAARGLRAPPGSDLSWLDGVCR